MRAIHTNLTYFHKHVHEEWLDPRLIHLPKHWFHVVLETRYKHLRHQMKSVSECSKQVCLDAAFTSYDGGCGLQGASWLQVCERAFEGAAAGLDSSLSLQGGSFSSRGRSHFQEPNQWPTGGLLLSLIFLKMRLVTFKSAVSVGMASVSRWCPLMLHPSSGQRSRQSPVETLITKISVKWGDSKVSIDTSVRKRKRAKGKTGGCQQSLVEVDARAGI